MLTYPAILKAEATGIFVSFPDIPEAMTQGATEEEALAMAEDALLTAMDFYIGDRRPVPMPSELKEGSVGVSLPASAAAKVLRLNEMLTQQVTPAS